MNDAIANDKRAANFDPQDESQQLAPQDNAVINADENATDQDNDTTNELENEPSSAPERDTAPEPSNELEDCVTDISNETDDADDELSALFSSFADVRASDALKSSTLDRLSALLSEASTESQPDDERSIGSVAVNDTNDIEASDAESTTRLQSDSALASNEDGTDVPIETPSSEATATTEEAEKAVLTATATQATEKSTGSHNPKKRSGFKARFRAIRVAAIAACLALAMVGGVAYATPTSHVQLSQGDTSIDLGVNRFGLVVSANSEDEAGQEAIKEGKPLNAPYDDVLERMADAMEKRQPDYPLEANVDSDDGPQREQLEGRNQEFLTERNLKWSSAGAPENAPGAGQVEGSPNNATGGWQPNATRPNGEPASGVGNSAGANSPQGQPGEGRPQQDGSQPNDQAPSGNGQAPGASPYGEAQQDAPSGGGPSGEAQPDGNQGRLDAQSAANQQRGEWAEGGQDGSQDGAGTDNPQEATEQAASTDPGTTQNNVNWKDDAGADASQGGPEWANGQSDSEQPGATQGGAPTGGEQVGEAAGIGGQPGSAQGEPNQSGGAQPDGQPSGGQAPAGPGR